MARSPPPPKKRAAAAKPAAKATDSLLSVILPTYNEAENLPIIVWLLVRELQRRRVAAGGCRFLAPCAASPRL
jgi:hypothetical protein